MDDEKGIRTGLQAAPARLIITRYSVMTNPSRARFRSVGNSMERNRQPDLVVQHTKTDGSCAALAEESAEALTLQRENQVLNLLVVFIKIFRKTTA